MGYTPHNLAPASCGQQEKKIKKKNLKVNSSKAAMVCNAYLQAWK